MFEGIKDMRAITKLLGAVAAIAISSAAATSANATIIMLPFAGFSVHDPLTYTGNVPGPNTGSLDVVNADTVFSFDFPFAPLGTGVAQDAFFTFHAVTDQLGTGNLSAGSVVEQRGFHGTFSITYAGTGGTPLPPCMGACTNLLSGTFTGGTLLGHQDSAHAEVSAGTALVFQTLNFSSDFYDFTGAPAESFSLTFDPVNRPFHLNSNGLIRNFTANSSGVAGVGVAVPEPTTWALMIMGFGGAGAMLRSRRRQAVAA